MRASGREQKLSSISLAGADNFRKRFTGYEKDDETGLDFAEARMYQNRHGRFTAPDPLLGSASATNPQTFNRYTYTGNNPVNITDPSGLNWCQLDTGTAVNFRVGRTTCDTGWSQVDGQYGKAISDFSSVSTNGPAGRGTIFRYNSRGTVTVADPRISADAAGIARVTGTEVRTEQSEVLTSSAAEIGTTITTRPLDGLPPCAVCKGDGSNPWSNPLAEAAERAPGLKSVEGIALIAEHGSIVPGVGVPFAIIASAVRLGQGHFGQAGENLLAALPFGKPDENRQDRTHRGGGRRGRTCCLSGNQFGD